MLNSVLARDLEVELLTGAQCKKIQESVFKQVEGTIVFFVRAGRLEKTTPPELDLMDSVQSPLMQFETYKAVVDTVVNAVKACDRYIEHGHVLVDYEIGEGGFLEKLRLYFKDVVSHNRKRK